LSESGENFVSDSIADRPPIFVRLTNDMVEEEDDIIENANDGRFISCDNPTSDFLTNVSLLFFLVAI
jgi:hypothetical protein